MPLDSSDPLGLYVHFPYCLAKCPYCDFVSFASAREAIDHERYADAVLRELDRRLPAVGARRLESVFFGGGTPSLWHPEALGRVLDGARAAFDVAPSLEVTVECNPSSFDRTVAARLLEVGVNRVSIGVQSLDPARLAFLGRLHDPEGGLRAVEDALAAGVPRVNADLIFGVAGGRPQSHEQARADVARVASLGVDHLSAYALTVEPGTRFGELARRGKLPILSDAIVAESYLAVAEELGARGFSHYEVSNHAKPGSEARHNQATWRGQDYLGLGAGAVGTLRQPDGTARRHTNRSQPEAYLAAALAGESTERATETLSTEVRIAERFMLGLRTREGVDLARLERELGEDPLAGARGRAARKLEARGQLEREGDRLRIRYVDWLFADGIAAHFV